MLLFRATYNVRAIIAAHLGPIQIISNQLGKKKN